MYLKQKALKKMTTENCCTIITPRGTKRTKNEKKKANYNPYDTYIHMRTFPYNKLDIGHLLFKKV